MDSSPPGSSVHGLSTARILEWVAISFSRVSSWPRDQTCEPVSSALSGRFFTTKPLGEPQTLVWQQWDSVMIPRVWLFVISVLFKTSANSFQYKYLLIVVHLWLVSGPACEGNKSSQKRCTFARIALNPHESFARYLMSTLYIVDLMLSSWLSPCIRINFCSTWCSVHALKILDEWIQGWSGLRAELRNSGRVPCGKNHHWVSHTECDWCPGHWLGWEER